MGIFIFRTIITLSPSGGCGANADDDFSIRLLRVSNSCPSFSSEYNYLLCAENWRARAGDFHRTSK